MRPASQRPGPRWPAAGPVVAQGLGAARIEIFGFAPVYFGSLADDGRLLQLDGHLSLLYVLKQD
jgi:hypothetical protein